MATLTLPSSQVRTQLQQAISAASEIGGRDQEISVVLSAYQTWDKRNEILLGRAFTKKGFLDSSPKDTYLNAVGLTYPFSSVIPADVNHEGIESDLSIKVNRLTQVLETLDAYGDGPKAGSEDSGPATVFLVHGRPPSPRLEVELLVRKATRLEPVVLSDQANRGSTLIEKLEEHLGGTSFAVIIMTADDLGNLNEDGEKPAPRARQNVVLELGFAMGALGRRRVAILHEEGIELPSDISGVAYYPLDSAGAWKVRLLGELQAAGIHVDANALLGL